MIETLNSYGRVWAEYFVWAVVQNTLFLGLVFLVLYWLRNASARVKYAIAAVGLVKLLLPPFVPSHMLTPAGQSLPLPSSTLLFSFADSPAVGPPSTVVPSIGLDPLGVMLLIWFVGAAAILTRSIIMTGRLATAVNDAVPVDDRSLASANARKTRIYKTDRIDIPLTIGILPHRIFVPTAWDHWTLECRSAVLKHEMAHIDRRDGFFQVLEIVVQALYFFHPMVLILNQRLREYREMACDDVSSGGEKSSRLDYSKFLVELAQTSLRPAVACDSASALLRRKNELFKRVAYQMKEEQMLTVSKKKIAVVLATLILAAVPLSLHVGGRVGADEAIAGEKTKSAKSSSELHYVDVALKGKTILIDGKKTSLESFSHAMDNTTNCCPGDFVVNITCHPDATMESLFEVQRRMLDLGLYKVSYTNDVVAELPVMLPTDDLKKKMEQISKDDIVYVRIEASGKVLVNKMKTDEATLTKVIEKNLQINPKLIVSVYMEDKTRYEDFVSVLANIKKAGADRIFINDPA
jgi:beta-lactamase regulating signal transducer with metallopeptidase domain